MPSSELVRVTLPPFTAQPAGSTTRPLSVAVNAADDLPYRGLQQRNRSTRAPSKNPSCRERSLPDIRKSSSKFWLTPGLHPVRLEQSAQLYCPRRPQMHFQILRESTRTPCVVQSYRESRARWQWFSGKGTGIRAIRPVTTA